MAEADFMMAALEEGRNVQGKTGDNPAVGCVLVQDGRVIAKGATQPPGGDHAEVVAILAAERAGIPIGGCDFYVTLEPCAFTGRTPPCTDLIIAKRPRRVVVGIRDPHPKVKGRGISALRAAGIVVTEGIAEKQVREMLAGWLARFDGE